MNGRKSEPADTRNGYVDFTVPPDTYFSVPKAETVTERPDEPADYIIVQGQDQKTRYWVHKGSLSLRSSHEKTNAISKSQSTSNWLRKGELERLEQDNNTLRSRLEHYKARYQERKESFKMTEKANEDLSKKIENLQQLLGAKISSEARIRDDYDKLRLDRAQDKEKWEDNERVLSDHILKLRGPLDEFKITEAELLDDYNTLIASIEACVSSLSHNIPEDKLDWQRMRLDFHFDAPILNELNFQLERPTSCLLKLVVDAVQPKIYSDLLRWRGSNQAQCSADFGESLYRFADEVAARVDNDLKLKSESARESAQKPRPAGGSGVPRKVDPAILANSYYRWRSDTTRLLKCISEQYSISGQQSVKNEIIDSVMRAFLQKLLPPEPSMLPLPVSRHPESSFGGQDQPEEVTKENGASDSQKARQNPENEYENGVSQPASESPTIDPVTLFRSVHETDDIEAQRRLGRFVKKLDDCVTQALRMFVRFQSCRANFILRPATLTETFNPCWMDICPPLPEDALQTLPKTLPIVFCKYPALLKHGDDDGKDYLVQRSIKNAQVVVAGIPVRYSSKSEGATIDVNADMTLTEEKGNEHAQIEATLKDSQKQYWQSNDNASDEHGNGESAQSSTKTKNGKSLSHYLSKLRS
jgi:hypothetical protein